jgi:uncharacterized protein
MIVAVALFEIHIEYAQSLKEKRMVVKSLRDRLRNEFRVAVNEVALHDLHQRARLAIALIAHENDRADSLLEAMERFIESKTDAVLTGWTVEKLEFDENAQL